MANNLYEWEQHLPYWQLVNKKGNVVMVPQNGPRSSPIHHQRILYLYHMNYYAILKVDLQVLHKIQPEDFQIALDKSSVLKFLLIKTKTYFTISFVFCTDTEMLSIKKIYDKSTSEKKNYSTLNLVVNQLLIYLVLHYLCGENITLKLSSLLVDAINIQYGICGWFGSRERLYSMGVNDYFGTRHK